jgi:hypothetical protein
MPGQRSKGQTFVGCYLDAAFLRKIDACRGTSSRSQFLRDAVNEKLLAAFQNMEGIRVTAPDRVGKGGPSVTPKETRHHSGDGHPVESFTGRAAKKLLK